jgi:hypothetical protein
LEIDFRRSRQHIATPGLTGRIKNRDSIPD